MEWGVAPIPSPPLVPTPMQDSASFVNPYSFVIFSYRVLGLAWYLIVSIPDLCFLPYFSYYILFIDIFFKSVNNYY